MRWDWETHGTKTSRSSNPSLTHVAMLGVCECVLHTSSRAHSTQQVCTVAGKYTHSTQHHRTWAPPNTTEHGRHPPPSSNVQPPTTYHPLSATASCTPTHKPCTQPLGRVNTRATPPTTRRLPNCPTVRTAARPAATSWVYVLAGALWVCMAGYA
jgi:hypothetical protein